MMEILENLAFNRRRNGIFGSGSEGTVEELPLNRLLACLCPLHHSFISNDHLDTLIWNAQ
jgi:hypothetical protein